MNVTQGGASLKQSQRDSEELKENGETASGDAARTFPPLIQQFGDDFTVLSTFVPTDTLEHQKNCGKNTRKSADAIAEFASSKGIRILSFLFTTSKCLRVQISRMMLYTLERLAGLPVENLKDISYMSY